MEKNKKLNVIHWFRKGLRLHDNPALTYALKNAKRVYPLFIFDPNIPKFMQIGANRWKFLFESLHDLDSNLKDHKSRLFVARGKPIEVLKQIIEEWKIDLITFEDDIEPYSKDRDNQVKALCAKMGIKVHVEVSHTLYDPNDVKKAGGGKVPTTYNKFLTLMQKLGEPTEPLEVPDFGKIEPCTINNTKFDVPTLAEIDINEEKLCSKENQFPGGEKEALKRLADKLKDKNWVCKFEKPKTIPNSLQPQTTTLSPYLKFGCLSVRKFYHDVLVIYNSCKTYSKPPVSLHGQLIWREFFYTVAAFTPNFDQMEGNPICKQIDWVKNEDYLEAWKMGRTGYPFIDSCMIQLRKEGWIHHLARHAVACFLTRGDLYVSWIDGMKVFEEYLIDADWTLNAANWMWLSASAFFHLFYRVYSPIAFGKKTDPNGDYIRKYLPILRKYPSKYIYEPWTAPMEVQIKSGCIIGQDYPAPIVDHNVVSKENIKRLKEAYDKNK